MAKFAEYCQTSLKRTKKRGYAPSRNEIIACLVSALPISHIHMFIYVTTWESDCLWWAWG